MSSLSSSVTSGADFASGSVSDSASGAGSSGAASSVVSEVGSVVDVSSETGARVEVVSTLAGDVESPSVGCTDSVVAISDPAVVDAVSEAAVVAEVVVVTTAEDAEVEGVGGGSVAAADASKEMVDGKGEHNDFLKL